MLSTAQQDTPLRPGTTRSYSLLSGLVTPFQQPLNESVVAAVPEDMTLEEYKKLSLSGLYMRAAVTPGRSVVHLTTLEAIAQVRSYYSFSSQFVIALTLTVLILLSFFEDGLSKIDPTYSLTIEFICLLTLTYKANQKRKFMGDFAFAQDASSIIYLCLLVVLFLDFSIGVFPRPQVEVQQVEKEIEFDDSQTVIYRYGRALRPFLLMHHLPSVRHRLVDLCIAGWRARSMFLLAGFNVIFFAVIGTILFHSPQGLEGHVPFETFEESLITLIILQTTSNSPGIFIPFFYESRWTIFYFVAFLLMSHFLLLNLMLGIVYHEHRDRLRRAASNELLDSFVACRASMAVLCDDVGTDRGEDEVDFFSVRKMLNLEFSLSELSAKNIIYKCGGTADGGVTRDQFNKIPRALRLNMSAFGDFHDEHTSFDLDSRSTGFSELRQRIKPCFTARLSDDITYVDAFVVAVLMLVLSSIVITMNKDYDAFFSEAQGGFHGSVVAGSSAALTLVFVLELSLKLFVFGFYRFTDNLWNIFDTICVTTSLIGVLQIFSPETSLLLVETRMIRLLRVVPAFRSVVGTAAAFAPAVGPSITAILCVFYSTAILAVGVLGRVRLDEGEYRANDFRDFAAALTTLFELSIVNDWNDTMAAFVSATGTRTIQIFFVYWWAISQLLLYNTVTSLVLDGFEVRMKELTLLETVKQPEVQHPPSPRSNSVHFQMGSPSVNEMKKLSLIRTLSSHEQDEPGPFRRGASFTVGRMFLELFRDIEEPSDEEVDIACWQRGIRVGKSPYAYGASRGNAMA